VCCVLKDKVLKYVEENFMIEKGDSILVALSGGPDSVCLLHILYSLSKKMNIFLYAAHVNHCLRGEEAIKDEKYAEELCKRLNIPFYCKRVDIKSISKERGVSTELAGRDERYKFFDELKENLSINKIAIAHNANDQAETLIMRIIRGTGLEGLVGIKPIRDSVYIRPILCLTRKEIEQYCNEQNLNPRIDQTNYEEIYSRNKIRLKAIPFIQENFNKDIVSTLNRLAYMCNMDNEFIESKVDEKYQEFCKDEGQCFYICKEGFDEFEALVTRIIRRALMNFSGIQYNFEMKHVYDIISLQKGESGKSINLPNGIKAINVYGNVKLEKVKEKIDFKAINQYIFNISEVDEKFVNKEIKLEQFGYYMNLEIIKLEKKINFSNEQLVKYFDYDKIKEKIIIRSRADGDKIIPLGMRGRKKLKDIFINEKIPKDVRDRTPIVIFDDEIAWVVGVKVSDIFKVTKDTKNILKINFYRKDN
jgi:tRNA(Ile)-lysidine synthase